MYKFNKYFLEVLFPSLTPPPTLTNAWSSGNHWAEKRRPKVLYLIKYLTSHDVRYDFNLLRVFIFTVLK